MDLNHAFHQLSEQLETIGEQTLHKAGERGAELARMQNLFHASDSFNQAIQFHPVSETSGFVLADKPYSGYLEEGNAQAGPIIYPKTAKALRFRVGTQVIFAKHVKAHEGYFFMQKAADKLEQELNEIFEQVCHQYL
jgi:hypothetical protein